MLRVGATIILLSAGLLGFADFVWAHNTCVISNGRCKGCGCKGGPGYRAPNGRCVGFRKLKKICGTPPSRRCAFENAAGTGANRVCATHKNKKK